MTSSSRERPSNRERDRRRTDKKVPSQVVIHPVLVALFPVFFLYAPNQAQFGFDVTFKPALFSTVFALTMWFALRVKLGDLKLAALWTSLVWLTLFSFDSLWSTCLHLRFGTGLEELGLDHQIKLGALLLAVAAFVIFGKVRKDLDQATYLFNVIGTILVCMALIDVARGNLFRPNVEVQFPGNPPLDEPPSSFATAEEQPDIYYIVLDGYGRADQLERLYGFDNEDFLRSITDQGFQVVTQAVSNYPQTLLSITSTLNFEYLHEMLGEGLAGTKDRRYVRALLRRNETTRLLKETGYHITSIASPYYEANVVEADAVFTSWHFPTVFGLAALDMTPLPWLLSHVGVNLPYDLHRSRILFALDQLEEMPVQPGPKFVYCHIMYAHPPFVFDKRGRPINPDRPYTWLEGEAYFTQEGTSPEEYIQGYRRQLQFLNQRLPETLATLIADSKLSPIIVVQGDHGPGLRTSLSSLENTDIDERYSILSAVYLPGSGATDLYETMSSVNVFRVIFNRYFGTSYPLLPDKLYYSPFNYPYDFESVYSSSLSTKRNVDGSYRSVLKSEIGGASLESR